MHPILSPHHLSHLCPAVGVLTGEQAPAGADAPCDPIRHFNKVQLDKRLSWADDPQSRSQVVWNHPQETALSPQVQRQQPAKVTEDLGIV